MSKETRTKLTCDACGLEIMQREDLDAPDPEEDLLVGWITVNGPFTNEYHDYPLDHHFCAPECLKVWAADVEIPMPVR